MRVPFTLSDYSITVFVDGKVRTVLAGHKNFDTLKEHLKQSEHDITTILSLSDNEDTIRKKTAGTKVTVDAGVVYYDGTEVHSTLTEKLLDLLDEGFDITPWAKFLDNLMNNPSYRSRNCLYDFLENFNAPITPEGKFIAFKRIGHNWKDLHTNTMDNSIGTVVTMDRKDVDDDPSHTCSSGLHVCADEYLKDFATGNNTRTVVVEVDPADVVAVPRDYSFAKMRVCKYKVIAEIEPNDIHSALQQRVWN